MSEAAKPPAEAESQPRPEAPAGGNGATESPASAKVVADTRKDEAAKVRPQWCYVSYVVVCTDTLKLQPLRRMQAVAAGQKCIVNSRNARFRTSVTLLYYNLSG